MWWGFFSLSSAIICYIIVTLIPLMAHMLPWHMLLPQWRIGKGQYFWQHREVDHGNKWYMEIPYKFCRFRDFLWNNPWHLHPEISLFLSYLERNNITMWDVRNPTLGDKFGVSLESEYYVNRLINLNPKQTHWNKYKEKDLILLFQNWTNSINPERVISDLSLCSRRWENKIWSTIICDNNLIK